MLPTLERVEKEIETMLIIKEKARLNEKWGYLQGMRAAYATMLREGEELELYKAISMTISKAQRDLLLKLG